MTPTTADVTGPFTEVWRDVPSGISQAPRGFPDWPLTSCSASIPGEHDLPYPKRIWRSEFGKDPSAWSGAGLCRSYVLMTNARVTGQRRGEDPRRLRRQPGWIIPLVLDCQWLCDQDRANRELRLFVPRVYGLGDLSQILDERAYVQASVLMVSARDQVATFVVTEPYRKAAQALREHGFVLLSVDRPWASRSSP